jgi:ATP-binding cassette subfamily B multidrug efflux pump
MRRFRPVLEILSRYRPALAVGFACVLLTQAANMWKPQLFKQVVDALGKEMLADFAPVKEAVLLLVAFTVARCVSQYFMRWLIIGVSRKLDHDLRARIYARLVGLHFGWFDTARTGDVLSRVTSDVEAVRMAAGPGVMYLANTLVAVPVALWFMFHMSPGLTGLILVPMVFVAAATAVISPRLLEASLRMQEGQAELANRAQESFAGVRVVKSAAREEGEIEAFRREGERYADTVMRHVRVRALMMPVFWLIEACGILLILWIGSRQVVAGKLTLGELAAFLGYTVLLSWPVIALGWVIGLFQRGAAAMDRINEVLDARSEVEDPPGATGLPCPRGDVEVRGLTFGFGANPPVIHDVSFRLPAGKCLGIIGPTGAGKSTLLSLLPRVYRVPEGTVFLDGEDVNRIRLRDLRRAVAVVPQETFLFSASIRENVAWGFEDGAPEGVVEAAAEASRFAPEVADLPAGYETLLGERGVNLSGGQKQRVAIARALALDAKVLILDDCLSSVDAHTEEEILRNLREAIRGRTTLMVSHRVAAISHADEILFLEGGRVVERGTHAQLLSLGGRYAELARFQALQAEVEESR